MTKYTKEYFTSGIADQTPYLFVWEHGAKFKYRAICIPVCIVDLRCFDGYSSNDDGVVVKEIGTVDSLSGKAYTFDDGNLYFEKKFIIPLKNLIQAEELIEIGNTISFNGKSYICPEVR